MTAKPPLDGRRILVPPARPESNPAVQLLEGRGATVAVFPALVPHEPEAYEPMDEALALLHRYHWIVFAGAPSVTHFFARHAGFGGEAPPIVSRIAAIGGGALGALRAMGIVTDAIPERHTAEEIVAGLGDVERKRVLLVRGADASRHLPNTLVVGGADVTEVVGYRMEIQATSEQVLEAFGFPLDALALTNPSAMRYLARGAAGRELDLKTELHDTVVAAAGPLTAETARFHGLTPQLVGAGRLASLVERLEQHIA